ncbi:MAG: hypothetical protein MjAS7_0959 [Metallosphaera javensis (ex Sakai et al. 2022)]|nr:MAG: hypothetical protein MjAS7_0959 [Metallosphaera javensis (ex Sakai et al. 2022)]
MVTNFPGLDRLISTLFPSSQHPVWFIWPDLQGASGRREGEGLLPSPSSRPGLRRERPSSSPSGRGALLTQASRLLEASDLYTFLNFPREVRHYIYTNNSSESFNSLTGYMTSEVTSRPSFTWRPIRGDPWKQREVEVASHVIRHHSYHLRQLHAARFQVTDHESL